MAEFTLYTADNAPEESKSLMADSVAAFGMVPNLHAVMAEAPTLLKGYQVLHELFQKTSFNAEELTVVWQSINVEHACHYCVPAHSAIAASMKVDQGVVDALVNKTPLENPKLETLRETTLAMTRERGVISDEQIEKFFAAGYGKQQLLEIIVGLSQKVMSNYTNHLADTPVDAPFKKFVK
ncbi:MAG TPA: carboxymuconolactone decarboxylase family protein [Pseudoalteromonas sp.]|uniref:Carboxymuconolactone decarboxylase-like domain-containing protein n=1 Tax=marine sediment metagenome TaxID=412755 RepID=A0A0F9P6N9_9ZZZZ|nr:MULTISPECIES: carboxymuconolactone decarboxylase family protein [unclassified Pseudoalteromonas]PLT26132.1 carboxymuconolactone decarboxylase family protein [Pseudoalteromonas sp. MelDa3]HDY94009.1 carboxymuconolactone decarboxylase family protein [Pseudoalteromonas sp.]HDZ33485.1 carboxymuconolactone decarboxylase family protein [Pseudoalteromonas sp.]|tara:strand:- start:898 stop:1440 length:543 start_codon:yes stop_codon:yes gene_type:complete